MEQDVFVHESSCVDQPCEIGAGTKIWHFCHVMSGSKIGCGCNIGQNVFIAGGVVLGDNVKVQNNVSLYEGVVLEDDVFCGPSCVFTNIVTPRSHYPRKGQYVETRVGQGATIGANATIVCGHHLGSYALIGAGAVVTRDVPDHALMVGVPARVAGWVCRCGMRLPIGVDEQTSSVTCGECGDRYAKTGAALILIGSEPDPPEE